MENKNYKSVSKIEVFSNPGFGIDIQLFLNRDLYEDEGYEINAAAKKIIDMINENTIFHSAKYKERVAAEKISLLACFPETIYVKEITNEYMGGKLDPWYLVTTKKGVIKIGWRKRVIVVDWTNSDIIDKPEDLFPNEDVTKSSGYDKHKLIHAWSYEKAKEYIDKLLQ